ncbi:glycerol-3-phosphate 1-O-acyltransferase PlsB [Colwellia sp. 1_MG-2023]|uniref:glycerol-3-phosphate 1-O-acyltransferase PlsB n=1 Tax=Colwellia sp. 1_MG-2023 TaxID=3062649 RepID=UPI0026E27413|nr:glycerol-3-phosphate 1-O-acyltransferase PlsB [Colwellia sp. 1_MG-2023]MDO6445375.1 glycerol-3-phosphate 1-O-acyltransferase PlsB [Colwellia sp. 1_MG-2023]
MLALRTFFYMLLKFPVQFWVKCRIVADKVLETQQGNNNKPIFYIVRHQSASDLLTLQKACKKLNFPDPLESITIDGKTFQRTLCLEKPSQVLFSKGAIKGKAKEQGLALLALHKNNPQLDVQLIPANLVWGRKPTIEKNNANVGTILADQESPSWLRKFFIVLFLGRNTLVRFSESLSLRYMADKHGTDDAIARKLLRVARFHFHRQKIAATGPRLMHRQQMFKALLKNPAIKKLIQDEVESKGQSEAAAKKQALKIMDEIAGDYRESMVRVGERVLHWLWNRLYQGIEVNNANTLRELADDGHEIIYVPCHRSHMDYLLLTYIIYQQGLVTPRIAAGINLNFWPAGPIFRKAGAFFIRRSFRGNRMYSTIFREYLGLLFERGYSVKYYSEGGRSRTGRLLDPKTGMLAMTIQSLLRGINRPLTLVPVYLGYEHVMEVGTYHKELSGSKKKNESVFGVFKAIKNLRNYGKGFVNFGTPININQFLTEQVPNWKDDIDAVDPQKPSWLTPSVNVLADQVMVAINKCAALNGVSLIALILLATKNKALSRQELIIQLDFFLAIQKQAPYSKELTLPEQSGEQLLDDAITLNKVTVDHDSFGDIISLSESAALEMRYYRNNILHTFMLPALVCRILEKNAKITQQVLEKQVQDILVLLKRDLFLWQSNEEISQQVSQVLSALAALNTAKQSKAGFWSLINENKTLSSISLLGECADETLQRLTIISILINRLSPINKNDFVEKVVAIAKRLTVLNNINAAEFIDKKTQMTLIEAMREEGLIHTDENGLLIANSTLDITRSYVSNLVDISVLQSILR